MTTPSKENASPIPTYPGLVIAYFGNTLAIETLPPMEKRVLHCHLHRNQELPVVGDFIRWVPEGDAGKIVSIEPRRSVLARGDARGKLKPLSANIDIITIVMSSFPTLSCYLLDRYLIAAEILNIQPILLVNKADLFTDERRKSTDEQLEWYAKIPYKIFYTSIYKPESLNPLAKFLIDKTAVLVGPSGVGKSSLIRELAQTEIKVGAVSDKGIGKHTTTGTRLYYLKEGGKLIDSPGVRDFSLWDIDKTQILQGFREFKPFLGECRFRDCEHGKEPGCTIQKAVADGKISPERHASYLALLEAAHKKNQQQYK